jgi:DNA-directed RNA polymerase specialized sigma24 family protein
MKSWDLTEPSLRALLAFLDPDPDRAPIQYEKVREKLIRFFEWKGCMPGDEFADETIDRVARRLESGLESTPENPYLFFHGVALNVIRERWRKAPHDPRPLELLHPSENPAVEPAGLGDSAAASERRLECLQSCLDTLPPASRAMLTEYHLGGSGVHIGRRKTLAARLKMPQSALRLRIYRIRRHLERCLAQCMERSR